MPKIKLILFLFSLLPSLTYGSTILVLGDSFSAGYGMKTEEGWVHLLSQELEPEYRVINASISGDTTQGGLSRLPRLIELKNPDYVIIELGGNDGLRGQSLRSMQNNLDQMINLCIEKDIVPILFKMRIPPNYGKRYATAFEKVFTDLTLKHNTNAISFDFESLISGPDYIQSDGIHPTAKAQDMIKDVVKASIIHLIN